MNRAVLSKYETDKKITITGQFQSGLLNILIETGLGSLTEDCRKIIGEFRCSIFIFQKLTKDWT